MLVCARCFTLLDTVDTLQVQIKLKKSEISNLYENSSLGKDKNIDNSFITTSDSNQNVSLSSEFESVLVKSEDQFTSSFSKPNQTYHSPVSDDFHRIEITSETTASEKSYLLVKSSDNKVESKEKTIDLVEPPKKKDKGLLTSTDLMCQICDKTFDKRRYLMDHLRRVHNSAVHQCKGCKVRYKYKEELINHQINCELHIQIRDSVKETVPQNQKLFTKRKKNNQCPQCDSYFLTQA